MPLPPPPASDACEFHSGAFHAHPPRGAVVRDRAAAAEPDLSSSAPHYPPPAWPLVHFHEHRDVIRGCGHRSERR